MRGLHGLAFAIPAIDIILIDPVSDANSFVASCPSIKDRPLPPIASMAPLVLFSRGGIMPHRTLHIARHDWLAANRVDLVKNTKNKLRSGRSSATMCLRKPAETGISSPNFT